MKTSLKLHNKKTLVFGASLKEGRASNRAVKMLRERDIQVVAIGARNGMVDDVNIQTALEDFKDIHTITLYMGEQRQKEFEEYLLSLSPARIIFNPGAENHLFLNKAKELGIEAINACTLVMLSLGNF